MIVNILLLFLIFYIILIFFLNLCITRGSHPLKDHSLSSKYVCSLIFKNCYTNVSAALLHFFSLDARNCIIQQTVLRIWCFEHLAQYLQMYIWALWNCKNNISEFLCRSIRNTEIEWIHFSAAYEASQLL